MSARSLEAVRRNRVARKAAEAAAPKRNPCRCIDPQPIFDGRDVRCLKCGREPQ